MRVIVSDAAAAIDVLQPEWTALAAVASEPNAFAEHWFVAASLRALAGDADVRLLEVRRGERLIGLLPVAVDKGYARLPVRIVQNWVHDQMFLGTPLVAAGEERAFWAADPRRCSMRPPGRRACSMSAAWSRTGRSIAASSRRAVALTVHRGVRALLESELSPDAYYEQAVRQKKRKEIRRLKNRLAEQGPVEARISTMPPRSKLVLHLSGA